MGAPTLPFPTSAASGVSKKKRTRKRTTTGTIPSAASLPTHMNQYQMATPLATNQATRAATTSGISGRRTRIFTVTCSKRSPKLQSVNKFACFVCTSPPNHSARLSTHCDRAMEDAYVRFGPNLRKIQAWPMRLLNLQPTKTPRPPQSSTRARCPHSCAGKAVLSSRRCGCAMRATTPSHAAKCFDSHRRAWSNRLASTLCTRKSDSATFFHSHQNLLCLTTCSLKISTLP